MSNITPQLKKLIEKPPTLTPDDMVAALDVMISKKASDVQVAAFLTGLKITGLDNQPEFIAAAAKRIFQESKKIDHTLLSSEGYVDIVGTGGDGHNTFNVSTSSAVIAAGMGIPICKHGGKAATSSSGAGDLLTSLGVNMSNVDHLSSPAILKRSSYCFLFAPVFHPIMANFAPLRKELGIPTIFNILGPLLNPAPLKSRIIGVYHERLGQVFAETVRMLNEAAGRPESTALIVCGAERLDEVSPEGETNVWLLKGGKIEHSIISPADFGVTPHKLDECKSGTPQENGALLRELLDNKLPENHPVLDYVLINAAALAVVDGKARDWKHGVELAKESITSGRAKEALDIFIKYTQTLPVDE